MTRKGAMIAAGWATLVCTATMLGFGPGLAARKDQDKDAASQRSAALKDAAPAQRGGYAVPPRAYVDSGEIAARARLEDRIVDLGKGFPGRVGIAVRDLQTGWTGQWQGNLYFPQQSVSKFWVALTVFDKIDRGILSLNAPVVVKRKDLTLFHQPIRQFVTGDGYNTTVNSLLVRALTQSDNTANDFLLWRAGGPDAVRDFLARHRIGGVRFGPGERLMQSQTAGLSWRQEYSIGDAFYRARAAVPMATRQAAFNRYLADPIDGATALGITDGLVKLKRGELLSQDSTTRLLSTMSHTRTGPQRLKGGLSPGWTLAHKTGTGQVLGKTTAGYNDVGIITCPRGRSFAVAVMIGKTTAPILTRQRLMNDVVRATVTYRESLRT